MRIATFSLCGVILASCPNVIGSSSPVPAVSEQQQLVTADTGYESLCSFKAGRDGQSLEAGLVALDGTLYGTTLDGGFTCPACGTVFGVSTSGKEHMLYRFKGTDGDHPTAGLVAVNDTLFGTTTEGIGSGCGGSSGECGTVFAVSTTGEERVLHRFKGYPDGSLPVSSL
jgi:hypothetical protein